MVDLVILKEVGVTILRKCIFLRIELWLDERERVHADLMSEKESTLVRWVRKSTPWLDE